MIRQSATYFAGRIIPGLVNLVSLAYYARTLPPDEYGFYGLVMSIVGMANAIGFQWLNLSLLRFIPTDQEQGGASMLNSGIRTYGLLVAAAVVVAGVGWLAIGDAGARVMILAVTGLTIAQSWYDLNLTVVNVRQEAIRHGLVSATKALVAFGLAYVLIRIGWGGTAVVVGLIAGLLLATTGARQGLLRAVTGPFDRGQVGRFLLYGIPLSLTFMLHLAVDGGNRLLLRQFMGYAAVGTYSAAYDLTNQSFGVLLNAVHLAAYPALLHLIENNRTAEAARHMRELFHTLLLIVLPVSAFAVLHAEGLARLAFHDNFQPITVTLVPFMVFIVGVWGFKAFYLDYAFLISRKTLLQVIPVAVTVAANLGLGWYLIPVLGLPGVVYATSAAVCIGTAVAWALGRRLHPYAQPGADSLKIALSTGVMAGVSLLLPALDGMVGLMLHGAVAGISFVGMLLATDTMRFRERLLPILMRTMRR